MEDITRDPDDLDYPDAWMWSFDDDDASRDAAKKVRQMGFFFGLCLIRDASLMTPFSQGRPRPRFLLLCPMPTSSRHRRQFHHRPSL